MVTILYFAKMRDAIGLGEELIALPAATITVADLVVFLSGRSDGHARAFADLTRVRAAVDLSMVGLGSSILGASEIAFFPPVTGG